MTDQPADLLAAAAQRLRQAATADQPVTLSPTAAEYLALWLETTASNIDLVDYCTVHGDDHPCRCIAEPWGLARAVLGQDGGQQ
ncbi:hypothetical protein [Kitasatospora cathayae]|uniref:Uncharacterized protein n=1 Tax=Kitasatospora cathayae TaxID=3004092 RepID=A0ABY7Q9S8_9ACTN|nr:hypothetical protein [Kitasatospora sp. HUAS 3-15]WBP89503.1 hypothetical protein O1G21_29130 [Kitasatospora sp. HUAS 3-15]